MKYSEYLTQYDCLEGNEDKLWFIASRYSSLMEIDRKSGYIRELYSIKSELQYRTFVIVDNRFLLFPSGKGKVIEYCTTDESVKYHDMPDFIFANGTNWSARHIQIGEDIYFFWVNPAIIHLNIRTWKWKLLDVTKTLGKYDVKCPIWFRNIPFVCDKDIYFHGGMSEFIIRLSRENDEYELIELSVPEKIKRVDNITCRDGRIWVQGISGDKNICILVCDDWHSFECYEVCGFLIDGCNLSSNMFCFYISEVINDELLLLPGAYDKAFLISEEGIIKDVSNQFPLVSKDKLRDDWISAYNYVIGNEVLGHFVIIHPHSSQVVDVNIKDGTTTISKLGLPGEFIAKLFNKELSDVDNMMYENNWDVSDMIYGIQYSKK